MRRRNAALVLASSSAAVGRVRAARTQTEPLTIYAAASLTDVFRAFDGDAALQLRGLERARDADPQRRARRRLRLRGAAQHPAALHAQGLVDKPVTFTANRLALIVPRSNPAGIRIDLRPQAQAGQARGRGAGRPGRRLHAHGAEEDGPLVACSRRSSARSRT